MDFTATDKEDIERQTLEIIAKALENDELTEAELPEISKYILGRIDKIENSDQLVTFLKDLSEIWPIFKSILDIEKGKVRSSMEKKAISDISTLTHNGNIEEAITMAKSATHNN